MDKRVLTLLIRKKTGIFLILILSAIYFTYGLKAVASEKIPNFGTMKEVYTKQSYFVINIKGKVKTIKMSEMETIMIARLFNTNNYTDTYTDNRFNPKIVNPSIEIRIKPNRIINLYSAGSGFVFLDKKKQYYVDQNRFVDFFSYCQKKYSKAESNIYLSNQKYKPTSFKVKDFLECLKMAKCKYEIEKTLKSEELAVPVEVISLYNEEINIFEFNDNIDMELGAIRLNAILERVDSAKIPHYFKKGNIVVTYNGENDKIIKYIEQIMGKQYSVGSKL